MTEEEKPRAEPEVIPSYKREKEKNSNLQTKQPVKQQRCIVGRPTAVQVYSSTMNHNLLTKSRQLFPPERNAESSASILVLEIVRITRNPADTETRTTCENMISLKKDILLFPGHQS